MKIKFPLSLKEYSEETTDLGWGIYPEGIYHMSKRSKKI